MFSLSANQTGFQYPTPFPDALALAVARPPQRGRLHQRQLLLRMPAMIVNHSRSFRLIVKVSMLWLELLSEPAQKRTFSWSRDTHAQP